MRLGYREKIEKNPTLTPTNHPSVCGHVQTHFPTSVVLPHFAAGWRWPVASLAQGRSWQGQGWPPHHANLGGKRPLVGRWKVGSTGFGPVIFGEVLNKLKMVGKWTVPISVSFEKIEWLEKRSRVKTEKQRSSEYFTLIAGGWIIEIKPLRKQFQSGLSSGGWILSTPFWSGVVYTYIYIYIALLLTDFLVAHLVPISISACFQENSRPYVPRKEVLHRWPKKTHFCLPSCTLVHATWNAKSLHNCIGLFPLTRPYFRGEEGYIRWG